MLSLSSSDYTHVLELVTRVGEKFGGTHLEIGLPSLRIESVSIDLMEKLKDQRSGGFTLAPEAATERMRRIINKFIPDEDIINTTREIYRRGWTTIKLYFMIGHPSETLEDVQAIADLCKRVIAEGRKVIGMKAKLNAASAPLCPSHRLPSNGFPAIRPSRSGPSNPCSRRELGRDRNIKLSLTKAEDSFLEAWLSRGDRRMAEVIYSAWKNGSKFDAWDEGATLRCLDDRPSKSTDSTRSSTPTASAARTRSSPGSISPPRSARISCSRISASRSKARSAWTAA